MEKDKILQKIDDILNSEQLTEEMRRNLRNYYSSLHNASPLSRFNYLVRLKKFGEYIKGEGKQKFEDATRRDIDSFLSTHRTAGTRNAYISTLKTFYNSLGLTKVVEGLKPKNVPRQNFTPSQLLTPQDVVKLAGHMPTEMNKVLTLTLYESAARIHEVLELRIGDTIFSSVKDKENRPCLVASLHFSRSKADIRKEPATLAMFAGELKRWIESHPYKDDENAYVFYSTRNAKNHIDKSVVWANLKNAAKKAGIKKKVNPHWLRHSMLSYLANTYNYNEQLLMWRAGWKNTLMAKRYIHSGGELERKAYLEKHGFKLEEDKKIIIKSKPCPHCNNLNPYTNNNCDLCGMPLDLDEYKKIIETKKAVEVERKLMKFEPFLEFLEEMYADPQKKRLFTKYFQEAVQKTDEDLAGFPPPNCPHCARRLVRLQTGELYCAICEYKTKPKSKANASLSQPAKIAKH